MVKKNDLLAAGFDNLMAQDQAKTEAKPLPEPEKTKREYKPVCYSLPVDLAEKIKDVAYWDRKPINGVVVEAFEQYLAALGKEYKSRPEGQK